MKTDMTLEYLRQDGLRNIANDPDYIRRQNEALYADAVKRHERRKQHAIYRIKNEPWF